MDSYIISAILDRLGVRHTAAFVRRMCTECIQGGNLFGMTRLLEVFGVKSHAVRIDDGEDFKDLGLPYVCSLNSGEFILVTDRDDAGPVYSDGKKETKSDWDSFLKEVKMLAVMLSAGDGASEPQYRKHRQEELYQKFLWAVPAAWAVWLLAMQVSGVSGRPALMPTAAFRLTALVLSAAGLFLCILLHRQWTGDGNAVEKVCSHFKTSSCSSAHDTFFFNRWFDLSEVGASYFLAIILIVLVSPLKAWSVAWMILPALPASLWNLGYQFFKQKHWCPLCVGVQILFWVAALAFLLCGAYSLTTFNFFDVASALLLWGTLLVAVLKAVTPVVRNRHAAEAAKAALSSMKGSKDVEEALLGEFGGGVRNITVAVSPTCPYCKSALETIETVLLPTGRFTLEKKYKSIHKGDEARIEELIGREERDRQQQWCDENDVNATPTVFVNGKRLSSFYSVGDLLYL